MILFKKISLFVFLVCMLDHACIGANTEPMELRIHSDQLVYITGEEIWVDGILPKWDQMPAVVYVRLLSRSGKIMKTVPLHVQEGMYGGYLELISSLPSDYYFIDCLVKGYSYKIFLQPVMVINPQSPPLRGCNFIARDGMFGDFLHANRPTLTDKTVYRSREAVVIRLGNENVNGLTNIYVRRRDLLSTLMDSLVARHQPVLLHAAEGSIESEGQHIAVRVVQAVDGSAARQLKVMASVLGRKAVVSVANTDQKGYAEFILPIQWDDCNIIFSVVDDPERSYRFQLAVPTDSMTSVDFPCLALSEGAREAIEARIFNARIQQEYYGRSIIEPMLETGDSTDFYGLPDKRYMLDDYTRFPNMEEILGEFVPEVRVRNAGRETQLQILNLPYKKYFPGQGLVLLDGVPVLNMKNLLSLDPLRLQSIDVIPREYYLGDQHYEGIIHYKSYKKDLAGYMLGPPYFIQPFGGAQTHSRPVFFEIPRPGSTKPDLRNVLWRSVQGVFSKDTERTFTFYTSDALGEYDVEVLFYTAKGTNLVLRTTITVE